MSNINQSELRQSVQKLHKLAENTRFSQSLITDDVDQDIYRNMCYQMWLITDAIEHKIDLPPDLERRSTFVQDIAESRQGLVRILPATQQYLNHIKCTEPRNLAGIIYCFYLGWLYGGQIIAKKLSLPKNHMTFSNAQRSIDWIRQTLLVDLNETDIAEAQAAFIVIIEIYQELYELH